MLGKMKAPIAGSRWLASLTSLDIAARLTGESIVKASCRDLTPPLRPGPMLSTLCAAFKIFSGPCEPLVQAAPSCSAMSLAVAHDHVHSRDLLSVVQFVFDGDWLSFASAPLTPSIAAYGHSERLTVSSSVLEFTKKKKQGSHSWAMQCTRREARSSQAARSHRCCVLWNEACGLSHEYAYDARVGMSKTCASMAHALTTQLPAPCNTCDDRGANSGIHERVGQRRRDRHRGRCNQSTQESVARNA